MIFSRRPKRSVPKPEPQKKNQQANPLYETEKSPEISVFRKRVLYTSGAAIILFVGGLIIYGPWFGISSIEVVGTRLVDPESVKTTAEKYTSQFRWLIVPNQNLWLLSRGHLANHLRTRIEERLAIENVTVRKDYPNHITIQVAERVPVLIWSAGQQRNTVDQHGIAVEPLANEAQEDSDLPIVQDEEAVSVAVNDTVLRPDVIAAIQVLDTTLKQYQRPAASFIIPIPSCVEPPESEEELVNGNLNTNAQLLTEPLANTETSQKNENTASNVNVAVAECDLKALKLQSVEIHVQLKDGPRLLFDRHQNLLEAVAIVDRVLTQPENQGVQYVDVRFGERVYLQ